MEITEKQVEKLKEAKNGLLELMDVFDEPDMNKVRDRAFLAIESIENILIKNKKD